MESEGECEKDNDRDRQIDRQREKEKEKKGDRKTMKYEGRGREDERGTKVTRHKYARSTDDRRKEEQGRNGGGDIRK